MPRPDSSLHDSLPSLGVTRYRSAPARALAEHASDRCDPWSTVKAEPLLELVASLVPLLIGPLLFRIANRARPFLEFLDGFTLVGIGGLVLLDILPASWHQAGVWVVPCALLGFFGPTLAERVWANLGRQIHALALVLGIVGLLLHGVVDGVALSTARGPEPATSLPWAVILHRLPVGLTIWWLLRPKYGRGLAISTLVALGLSTIGGFTFGGSLMGAQGSATVGLLQALICGSLLHVLAHSSYPMKDTNQSETSSPRWHVPGAIGALLGIALVAQLMALPHSHGPGGGHSHGDGTFGRVFFELAIVSAPALFFGYLAAGLVHGFLPKASVSWMSRGSRWGQSTRGLLFGLPIPICSCGVIPVYQSLVMRGVPMAAAVALLVSAPELGLDAVFLSFQLLGTEVTIARIVAAALVALLIGVFLASAPRVAQKEAPTAAEDAPPPSFKQRLRTGLGVGFGEMVDHTGPWVLLGLALAAAAAPLIEGDWLRSLPTSLEIPIFALLGMPLYVCASGATPLVAILLAKGASPGAVIAFLLTGPATNVTTFGLLKTLHGRATALRFVVAMAILAILVGVGVNAILGRQVTLPQDLALPSGHDHSGHDHSGHSHGHHGHAHHDHGHGHHHHGHGHGHSAGSPLGPFTGSCLALLVVLMVISLLRQGPRAFLGEIFTFPGSGHEDHHHGRHHHH